MAGLKDGLKTGELRLDELELMGATIAPLTSGGYMYVDGNKSASGDGTSWDNAFITIQEAVTASSARGIILIEPKNMAAGATDPGSYEENIVIPATHESLSLIGVNRGRTQGGLPQLKDGATTTQHILTIRSAGCLIANLGFNGAGNTGGGILLDDDASTKSAFGTTITGCHFKNCKGTTATNAATGGAICWSSAGGAWQVLIKGNKFYKNVGDVVLLGTTSSVPQDVVIEDNIFSGPAANVDCNLYLAGGSGMNGVVIRNNSFQQLPAVGSATNARYIDATGCTGMLVGNTFGCLTANTGTTITFKTAGTGAKIPTTMHVAGNYGQSDTAGESGEITIS